MKKNKKIEIGQKFGKLTILKEVEPSKDKHKRFLCKCECGKEQVVYATKLRTQKITMCKKCSYLATSEKMKKHGLKYTKEYNIWQEIKQRCYYKKHISYKYYGEKGIKMCDEWKNSPKVFIEWYRKNYKPNCTIDRIDFNGDYCPENCRFATLKEQQRNKTNNVLIEYQNKIITAAECAELVGISNSAMIQRIKRHGNDERIFNKQWRSDKHKNQYTIGI